MRVVSLLLFALIISSLQGCFPVIAVGVGAGVIIAKDRRTKDVFIHDKKIESDATTLIDRQFKSIMHVNVSSFNSHVLLTGEVPDESIKGEIEKTISGIENVHGVYNELTVSRNSSLPTRSNDGLITSNVKLRFMNSKLFSADHVKVVTESATVYLMGLVKHAEADAAADIASTTQGVERVVKMFDYLD